VSWLATALELAGGMLEQFEDKEHGGFYFSSGNDNSLLVRRKDYTDGAIRSGNSVGALLLFRLARFQGDDEYSEKARRVLSSIGQSVSANPLAYMDMLNTHYFEKSPLDIVIVGPRGRKDTDALIGLVRSRFIVGTSVVIADSSAPGYAKLQKSVTLLEGREMIDGKATAYVCIDRACLQPVTTAEDLGLQLDAQLK
jgi:uncharacterized protein YyaL (SSP411 family)